MAESGAGCKTPRDEDLVNLDALPTDQNLCTKMAALNKELHKQAKWIEKTMASQGGCTPSCTRYSYQILEGLVTEVENEDVFYYDYDLYGDSCSLSFERTKNDEKSLFFYAA